MVTPKVGMRFLSQTGVHTITKLINDFGGGFSHSYNDGKRTVKDAFMYNIAFKRLQECGAIVVLRN